jgi:hypothetical protein
VIANNTINLAVLEVAVNAATLKLAGQPDQSGPFQNYSTMMGGMPNMSMPQMPSAPMQAMPMLQMPNPMGSMPGVPNPQMLRGTPSAPVPVPRPLGSSSSVSAQKPFPSSGSSSGVTDTWTLDELMLNGNRVRGSVGPAVMQHILKALFRFVGAHAKAIIVEELSRLSATPATVMPAIFTDFIHNVASRIPDPGVQDEFIDIALGDRK